MAYFALLASFSTLICCVLPLLLVSLGLGASLVGLLTEFPQLIWLSENKGLVFLFSFLSILASGALTYWQRNQPCPLDPELRKACLSGRAWSLKAWFGSATIFSIGFFAAYVLPLL